jgi:hypothetical protein
VRKVGVRRQERLKCRDSLGDEGAERYQSRCVISMHNALNVRCDGEKWALGLGQELRMIDARLKMVGIDTRASSNRVRWAARIEQ